MSTRVLALAVVPFAMVAIGSPTALAQAPIPAARAADEPPFTVPRTSWGDPDLQGVWDYRTITPLERRPELGDREFYTDEEIAQLQARAARRMDQPPDENTPANLVHADYATDPGRFVDEARRTSLIVEPKNGRMPALTSEAQRRQEQAAAARAAAPPPPGGRADSYTDRPLLERCITRGLGGALLPGLYNNNIRIAQAPGYVAIVHEMVHETRLVQLDGAFNGMRGYMGESRGHWEGDTLVVETRNFNGRAPFRGAGANLVTTERYTRVGPESIDFRLTFEDDTQWTQPWTVAYFMRPAEGELYEYACHEGNYGLRNILENARYEEQAAAEAARKQ
jgi:hypothetical protein